MKRKLTKEGRQRLQDEQGRVLLSDYLITNLLHDLDVADQEVAELREVARDLADEVVFLLNRYDDGVSWPWRTQLENVRNVIAKTDPDNHD